MRQTGSKLTQQEISGQKERYPRLGNTLRQTQDEEQLPVSRFSAQYKIPRKEVSSPNLGKLSNASKDTAPSNTDVDDPFKDGVYESGLVVPTSSSQVSSRSPSSLSAGAAAVEKSAQESKPAIEPRQTRTSSLRARLSAGQLIKDDKNKVVGFTDFTAYSEPAFGDARRDSLRARKEAQARRSLTPPHQLHTKPSKESVRGSRAQASRSLTPPAKPVPHPLRPRPSRESHGGNRAPAQFVAGSRRPTHPRRPSSRGSIRSEFREATPPPIIVAPSQSAPNRPAPAIPVVKIQDTKHGNFSEKAHVEKPTSPRKSSIPVPRQLVPSTPKEPNVNDKAKTSDLENLEASGVKREARNEFAIFEGHSPVDIVRNLDQTLSNSSPDMLGDLHQTYSAGRPSQPLVNDYGAHVLEAIEESPQHAYQLKRLSTASPEFGPTLKISPSAERFIMGTDDKTEKHSLSKKKSKELDRAMMKQDQKDRKDNANSSISNSKDIPDRPSSSQGLSRRGPRIGSIDTKAREKKVKSADLGSISPIIENLLHGSHKLISRPNNENADMSARGSTSTSFNDPFFDARSQLQSNHDKGNDVDGQETNVNDEEPWIPLLGNHTGVSNDNLPITAGSLPIGSHTENGIRTNRKLSDEASSPFESATTVAEKPEDNILPIEPRTKNGLKTDHQLSDGANPFEETAVAPKEVRDKDNAKSIIFVPSTPNQHPPNNISNSGSHPPRSSSRLAHPDFTTAKTSPASPLTATNGPPTPPKDKPQDFAHRQNNLGSLRGHGTSQLDLADPAASKRDSTARESNKSHASASASKSSLSIFRTLFHKRSSESDPLVPSSAKKSKSKSKHPATYTPRAGSPFFPPISEIHPIHRPTLASIARSAAAANNNNNNNNNPRSTTTPRPTTPATPTPTPFHNSSHTPTEISTSTHLALELLDLSRKERSSPLKENLLRLGSVLVEGIAQARNAEKALEEARLAARRAEVAHLLCERSLREVMRCVEGWRMGGLV